MMIKLAKLASPLNWRHRPNPQIPVYYLFTDQIRLPDPLQILAHLPRGACVVVRHTDSHLRLQLAQRIILPAHRLGLKVFLAEDMRLALRLGADGVHLSEQTTRRCPSRCKASKPGFLISCAAHSQRALWWAGQAGVDICVLSPVFPTKSHPNGRYLGHLRAIRLAQMRPVNTVNIVALGGISALTAQRLRAKYIFGLAAIEGWLDC